MVINLLGGIEKINCSLLVMCDLTSFENGELGEGRGGGLEFRVLMNMRKCRDFSKGEIFRQLLWYFWEGSHRLGESEGLIRTTGLVKCGYETADTAG